MKVLYYAAVLAALMTTAASAETRQVGSATVYTAPSAAAQSQAGIDYANAKPMPLPTSRVAPPTPAEAVRQARDPLQLFGNPGASPGQPGDGKQNPVQLPKPQASQTEQEADAPTS